MVANVLMIFMITGHKYRRELNLHKEKDKKLWSRPYGVAYLSRVENQAKRSSVLVFVQVFVFLKVLVTFDRARVK